jgi:hypothetical protein
MMEKCYGKKTFLKPRRGWDENIKIDQMEGYSGNVNLSELAENKVW